MTNSSDVLRTAQDAGRSRNRLACVGVLLIAAVIYLGCIVSPPSLMDDVDATIAQMSRNMVASGDWVTPRLDGIALLEKPPLYYWPIALSYNTFGVHDWAARIPIALSAIGLALLTAAMGVWAFGKRAGFYAGLCMATCIGLFLFTRILIPDVMLTLTIALAMWAFLRVLDPEERHPRAWAAVMAAAIGTGLLLKSLIAMIFPVAAALIYLAITRQLFSWNVWKRIRPFSGVAIAALIAGPWTVLATLRNPPTFAWTLHSGPGEYHGFLWFYFINEQLLRFLNLRYPHDYATVPRFWFWTLHLVWLFPWSVYFPAIAKLSFRPVDRAGRTRLLALCWLGFILVFFTFSTTQEYYSMPCYPAMALLLGSAMAAGGDWIRRGTRTLAVVCGLAALACLALLVMVRGIPTPGDISAGLTAHPHASRFSLGQFGLLTINTFAYWRVPLAVAAVAFLIGTIGSLVTTGRRAFLAAALMMVVFFHAARLALVEFDPFLSSRAIAKTLLAAPEGQLILNGQFYVYSSLIFYTNRNVLILNGRINNLVYGSYAPGAPDIFIDDAQFKTLWSSPERRYIVTTGAEEARLEGLVGAPALILLKESGGKSLFTNLPLTIPSSKLEKVPGPLETFSEAR
jgi:4-amino-4-deoxy-L-arabinose transferase-like glycosyltransferase